MEGHESREREGQTTMTLTTLATQGEMIFVELGGDVYTAHAGHGIDIHGWPVGMRFVCTVAAWPKYKASRRIGRKARDLGAERARRAERRAARRAEEAADMLELLGW